MCISFIDPLRNSMLKKCLTVINPAPPNAIFTSKLIPLWATECYYASQTINTNGELESLLTTLFILK